MSVLFPKVNKAPEWHWRPIHYDPKKDEMESRLRELQQRRAVEEGKSEEGSKERSGQPYTPTLHRGSFRESHEENMSMTQKAAKQSKAAFWIALLAMIAFLYWLL